MEREFYILVLQWLMTIAARLFAGERHPADYTLLKEQTENFIKREEGK